jgi:hypothetical protein
MDFKREKHSGKVLNIYICPRVNESILQGEFSEGASAATRQNMTQKNVALMAKKRGEGDSRVQFIHAGPIRDIRCKACMAGQGTA